MRISIFVLLFCALPLTVFAEGSGDYCRDRIEAVKYFSYLIGHAEGQLDFADGKLLAGVTKKQRAALESSIKTNENNIKHNEDLMKDAGCINSIERY